ncbi:hypothetical protein CRG98_015779, partial [Punica granatum]
DAVGDEKIGLAITKRSPGVQKKRSSRHRAPVRKKKKKKQASKQAANQRERGQATAGKRE